MSEAKIHATAIVEKGAKIGSDCEIGPGAILGPEVELGSGCIVGPRAVLQGRVKMGDKNRIGVGAVIGGEPQDLAYQGAKSGVVIGEGNTFREYVTIHRGTKEGTDTVIGNGCFLMVGAHVAHNCRLADGVILVNNVLLAGYVEVEEKAFLGGAVVVHQFVRIGKLAMVRGQTRVGMDLPPYCMAVATNGVCGLNLVGLKRAGVGLEGRKALQRVYEEFFFGGKNRVQALEEIRNGKDAKEKEVKEFCDFIDKTKRGVCHGLKAGEISLEEN
jgi:UDP-N-acetylglucosamine acyltransferase